MTSDTIRISVKGKPIEVPCLVIEDRTIRIKGRFLRIAGVFDDFLDSRGVDNPTPFIQRLRETGKADIFTFLCSFKEAVTSNTAPTSQYSLYHMEHDYLSATNTVTFDHWWKNEIKKKTRRNVKKAEELGIKVRSVPLDDHFIQGVARIFNETPIRGGKTFWHYGKDFEQIKMEISTYADRSIFFGAYWKEEMVGFAKLINCGDFGRANQLLSMVKHRDKPITNPLIAEMVRTCERLGIPHLIYGVWSEGSLGIFKQNNGFSKLPIPRYYAPLNFRGKFALKLGIHRGMRELIPTPILRHLLSLRQRWYKRSSVIK